MVHLLQRHLQDHGGPAAVGLLALGGTLSGCANASAVDDDVTIGYFANVTHAPALIADGAGAKVPKGYIYAAMAFSALVETLNLFARRAKRRAKPPAEAAARMPVQR